MITQTYTISTIKQSTPPIVKMSQYDHGSRTITFSVVDGSGQAVVLTGKTVRVEGTRLDGHAFAEDCTVSGSTASFTDTSDMTNAPGAHPAELVIESDGDRLGTMNFVISVETAAMDENADITEEDVSLFEQLLGSIEDATGAVEAEKTAALSAIDDDKDAALLAIAQGLASGSPLVVDAVVDMTDQTAVYLYSGSESGYTAGNYYFYNGSAWVSGGTYGNPTVDAAFSNSSVNPVQNKVVSAAVSELKSDVTSLDETVNGQGIEITFVANEYINSTDGSFVSYNGWTRSNLIDCSAVNAILYTNTGRASRYNAFYDENGDFISSFNIQQTQTGNWTRPANAKYFAYSNFTADIDLFTWVNQPAPAGGLVNEVDALDDRVTVLENALTQNTPEIVLPPYAVAVVGHEFNMYTENVVICKNLNDYIWAWKMLPYATQYNQYDDRFSVIPATGSERTYTLSLTCVDKISGETLTSASMSLYVVSDSALTGKKMLMIGDSLTAAGYSAYEIANVLSAGGVASLGTITATPWIDNVQRPITMEGRGGWNAYDYMHTSSKNGNTNAFLNPSSNLFDFTYYMNQQGYTGVDIVLINLGTNGVDNLTQEIQALEQMIASIHTFNANIPVVVHLTPPPATQNGWTYINHGSGAEEFRLKTLALVKAVITAFGTRQEDNIYISDIYGCLDRYHDFAYHEAAVSQRNPFQVIMQVNNMHPSAYGYYKFADVYWGMIEYLLAN